LLYHPHFENECGLVNVLLNKNKTEAQKKINSVGILIEIDIKLGINFYPPIADYTCVISLFKKRPFEQ
jgi:hypothetical protein